jgi:hypothetical protein
MDELMRICYNVGVWLFNDSISIASFMYNAIRTSILLILFPWQGLVIALNTGDKEGIAQFFNAVIAEVLILVILFKVARMTFPTEKDEKKSL